MRDDEEAALVRCQALDPFGDDAEGIDIEPGVRLVEHGQLRLEDRHLENLVPFPLPTGEPLIQVPVGEARVDAELPHGVHDFEAKLQNRVVGSRLVGQGGAQEVDDRDAGDLLWVLEPEVHPGTSPLVGRQLHDVLPAIRDRACRDLVGGMPEEDIGQRRLPRPIWSHQRMDLTFGDGEVDALEDLDAVGRCVQIVDDEQWSGGHMARLGGPGSVSAGALTLESQRRRFRGQRCRCRPVP